MAYKSRLYIPCYWEISKIMEYLKKAKVSKIIKQSYYHHPKTDIHYLVLECLIKGKKPYAVIKVLPK